MITTASKPLRRLRRSLVLVPGHKADLLEKALTLEADVLILDLQDSVPVDAAVKARSRDQVRGFLRRRAFKAREASVRVNEVGSPWLMDDLRMAVEAHADSITLPEIREMRELHFVEVLLEHLALDGNRGPTIQLEVEAPELLLALDGVVREARRVDGLCVAPFDYALNVEARVAIPGRPGAPTDAHLSWLRPRIVAAARAAGWNAVDAVAVADPKDLGLVAGAANGSRLTGFDGMAVMHPTHLETVNAAFSPSAEEIAWAKERMGQSAPAHRQQRRLAERLLRDAERIADADRMARSPKRPD